MKLEGVENEIDTRVARSVGRLVSASVDRSRSAATEDRSFALVEERLARRSRRIRGLRAAIVLAGVVVGAGVLWQRAYLAHRVDQQMTYQIGRGLAMRNGDLVASSAERDPADVRFSDGTLLQMEPHTRSRVVRLNQDGATVAVYEGKVHVNVRHRANARWLFNAGPFEVRVHGTAFSLAWNAASAQFDLQMESGVVSVAGPLSGGEIVLRSGQKLSVTLGDHDRAAGSKPAAVSRAPEPDDAGAAAPVLAPPDNRRPDALAAAGDRSPVLNGWRAELAEGHAASIVAEAQRRGLGRALDTANSEDLAALADAARYVGNQDVARRALHAQRQRFPGSKRAAEAAFLLGRLEGESPGGVARALVWYDRCLTEAPSGVFASEALGRKMMVLERSGKHEDAIKIARAYLNRFATGSYAHAASVLTDSSERAPSSPQTP
jgi:TolA-binding protein